MNKLPFPKIDPNVFDREGMKECYVFKPKDTSSEKDCPTIIHFVLANIDFRKYKAPGELTVPDAESPCSSGITWWLCTRNLLPLKQLQLLSALQLCLSLGS